MTAARYSALEDSDDQALIESLYVRYNKLMYATAAKLCQDPVDRQDIVQESLICLIDKVDLLRGFSDCILAGYIVSTVRNNAINYTRRSEGRQKQTEALEESADDLEAAVPSLDRQLISRETVDKLWRHLSQEDRFLLEGRYIIGMTDRELADRLRCKEDSIRMKMTRARRRALTWLEREERGGTHEEL